MPLTGFTPTLAMQISEFARKQIEKGIPNGPLCTAVDEPIPGFEIAPCEDVYPKPSPTKKGHNSYIVFGRDRTSSLASGAGGTGFTQSGMIDIVAGRFSSIQSKLLSNGKPAIDSQKKVNPNFAADAARIYITQKTLDIDEALGFVNETKNSKFHSAIAIKSDHTRIVGRELVRIYAGTGDFDSDPEGETAANGDKITPATGRIELFAGRIKEENLQPAVLGTKLRDYLSHQSNLIIDIYSSILTINEQLAVINTMCAGLPGAGALFGRNTSVNIRKMLSMVQKTLEVRMDGINYLEDAVLPGNGSFLSKSVFLT